MNESTPVLEVRGITKQYPGVKALKGVDFDVRAGEVHCLLGPNGAGKSTLIKCVSGVVAPTEGEIRVEGELLPVGEPSESMALGVGTIYQELDLVEDLRVSESVFLGHEPRRLGLLDRARMRSETTALLERLDHGDIKPDMFVRTLRPAAQQVVSICRALSRNVKLLIMDEPSSILDDGEVEILFGVVLAADGVGVIYISHRLDEIPRIGDRVTVLSDGRTVATGLPADTPRGELVEKMVGRKVDALFPHRAKPTSEDVVLDVRGVSGAPRVKECSFQVRAGEVLGIGGLVGAGRSELLRLVYGLDRLDTGEVYLDGKQLPSGRPDVAIDRGMGLAPEDRKSQGLLLGWSLAKNVSISDLGRFTTGGWISLREERKQSGDKLRELNTVPDNPDRITRELSGGNQQKVVLARWLLRDCRVLLLDEPTRGVDVGAKAEIYKLVVELAATGVAVVMVSSEMEELMGLSSRILIMREGELVAEVDGQTATEVELLSHAVAPTDTDVVLEETR
jgi:ribose transport system ATP-binding protein